jgi:hypothetical protein
VRLQVVDGPLGDDARNAAGAGAGRQAQLLVSGSTQRREPGSRDGLL